MNMRFILFYTASLLLLASCKPEAENPNYSSIPHIEYNRMHRFHRNISYGAPIENDSIQLVVTCQDGDSDLGLDHRNTYPPYQETNADGTPNKFYDNYFLSLYKKQNGKFIPISRNSLVSTSDGWMNGRLSPFLNGEKMPLNSPFQGTRATTKWSGEIVCYVLLAWEDDAKWWGYTKQDTLKFTIQVADRALNLSNIVETEEITYAY